MERVIRFGVSLEPDLLERFDTLIEERGYANRSEAIRDLIRKELVEADIEYGRGMVIGTLTIVYDHEAGDVTHKLLHLQHSRHSAVRSTMHIHLDEHNCLEVLVVEGDVEDVRKMAESLRALKGVKYGELSLFSPSV
ncbi:MAG: nickel-responsive transcriptional regulator NikR [Thermoplasmata archaeon]|nr:nickel-responsive transcriptional regulator NikR [Thermoplasmata archaeon]RLF28139.1 MAG: nickel-responsive transcriptional regulator NikR [Thermoplasmata archaeon]